MKLTVETLAHAISNFIDSYESTDALTILRDEFRLSDNEIREMGLDYLFDLAEPDEPDEEPLKTYRFVYHVFLDTTIDVRAHNDEEAEELAEAEVSELAITELNEYESGIEWIETFN